MADEERDAGTAARSFRTLLIGGAASAFTLVLLALPGDAALTQDAQLLLVLQGMALIKAALLAGVGWALWLRARWPMLQRTAFAYHLSIWLMAGATAAIWRAEGIALAAIAFHLGLAALAVTAWRDRASGPSSPHGRQAGDAEAAQEAQGMPALRRAA